MSNLKSKKRLIILIPLLTLTVLIITAGIAGSIRQADAVQRAGTYDWKGQFFTVGSKQIYAEIGGKSDAVPVVFVPGLADGVFSWCTYVPTIADSYQTITYDPCGIGQSGASSDAKGSDAEINDLHGFLAATGIEGPYVLVGHSRGGVIVRRYAQLFPEDVMGVVLVDATNEVMISSPLARASYQGNMVLYEILGFSNQFGIPRLVNDMGTGLLAREIDEEIVAEMGWEYLDAINEACFRSGYITEIAHQFGSVNEILDTIRSENQPLDIPAYVLFEVPTDDPDSPVDDTEEMLRLCIENVEQQFPDLQSQIVYDAGHYIHVTRPEEVTAGINWIISQY